MIPFLDVHSAYAELRVEIDDAIHRVLDSGTYILGQEVTDFETAFAEYCEARHCIGVGNGLDALRLALLALGVEPGDEVIVPSNTYIATWLAVSQCGATPVPVEPDPATHNIDCRRIVSAITPRTKVILPVHLYGQPAAIEPILAIASDHGVRVLEDAAQAHGARYRGKRIGAHGNAVAWSFYPGKNLGAVGDAGAVTTDDPIIAERVRLLGNYGSRVKYTNEIRGTNSRLDPLQAAVLAVKLRWLDRWNDHRKALASLYQEHLQGLMLKLPEVPDWADPAWHLFVVGLENRNAVQEQLQRADIGSLIHYPIPPHLQQAYVDASLPAGSFPIAEHLAGQVLSLPIGPHTGMEDVRRVCEVLAASVGHQ